MKRFTETSKWQDPFFRCLSAPAKMLWFYILDHCDNIGLVEINTKLVSLDCGLQIKETHIKELGERLQNIGGGKYFVGKFIKFQYGKLSASCIPHKKILEAIEYHSLKPNLVGYAYPTSRVGTTLQEKKEDKEEEEDSTVQESDLPKPDLGAGASQQPPMDENPKDKAKGTLEAVVAYCVSRGLPESDGQWFFDKAEGCGWKNGGKAIVDWRATVRSWITGNYFPSLKLALIARPPKSVKPTDQSDVNPANIRSL